MTFNHKNLWVTGLIDFFQGPKRHFISTFETIIRYLQGFCLNRWIHFVFYRTISNNTILTYLLLHHIFHNYLFTYSIWVYVLCTFIYIFISIYDQLNLCLCTLKESLMEHVPHWFLVMQTAWWTPAFLLSSIILL